MDFDLDSLLSDLTSFDPNAVVAASHPAPPIQPFVAIPPAPVRSDPSSTHSTPQHARAQQPFVELSPTPPSTPGTTPSHVPLRSHTQVDRNYQPRRSVDQLDPIPRSYTEAKYTEAPDHKRPAGMCVCTCV